MAARAIGSAAVSFGLVSIPVKLYSANQTASTISFNLLHQKCGSRLKQQYTCPVDNVVVPREDMVKGYEFTKGKYVTFTEQELEKLEAVPSAAIEITEFIPHNTVEWPYFDKVYYLGPDKGGERAYQLLHAAMQKTQRCAVAKYAARGKQYLVLVRPMGEGLLLQQLHYADEVKPFSDVPIPKVDAKGAELDLAVQLIEQIKSDSFNPTNYRDEVKLRIEENIARKVEGQEITATAEETSKAQIVDLLQALKASLSSKPKPAKRVEALPGRAKRSKAREG